jgi:hypothetical protein
VEVSQCWTICGEEDEPPDELELPEELEPPLEELEVPEELEPPLEELEELPPEEPLPEELPPEGAEATWMENAGSDVLWVPSLTLITMFASVPTSAVAGVPLSSPVAMLKLAQGGLS